MIDYLRAPKEPERVLPLLNSAAIRIVTLTTTEGGYNIDERTYYYGKDDAGQSFEVIEPTLSEADWAVVRLDDDLGLFRTSPFGALQLDRRRGFIAAYRSAATAIARHGVKWRFARFMRTTDRVCEARLSAPSSGQRITQLPALTGRGVCNGNSP